MPALRTKGGIEEGETPSETSSVSSGVTPDTKTKESESKDTVRRSGRKYKQRILFGHEKKTDVTPSPSTSKKQKHPRKTVEKSDSDNEEEHEKSSEEQSGSSDSEEIILPRAPSKGRKSPATTTPKRNPFAKRGRPTGTSSRKRKDKASIQDDDAQGSLFDIVKAGKGALRALVDDWIESYNKKKEAAMVDIIQFFVQCCGCKGTVTRSMLDEEENVDAVRQLTEQFDEESHEYPLIMSGPLHKKFKTNFVAFVHTLIVQCQHSIIYDEYMLDTLVSWLIRLSDSQVRAFRHTSTLAGMKLVSALIHVAKNVHVELDNTQRQLDSETQKATSKKALEKIDMLQTRRQELRQNINDLEEMMNFIFQGMFVHRYRDSRPEIRALCISEIGEWMKEYSTLFLNDRYLKYIVWNLHDKIGEVRLRSIQALLGLYEDEDLVPHLDALTSRFKDRFVSMTLDKDNEVAVEAVKLTGYQYQYEKLDEEDCQQIQLLVFCTHRQVAHAAGQFLYKRIKDAADEQISSRSKKGDLVAKKSDKETKVTQIKKLLEFFINSEVHHHGAYLVDSLWSTMPVIKDWKLMTDMLLEDKTDESGLDDKEEAALIEILVSSCKQASLGQSPPGRATKKTVSSKEKKAINNDKKELSAHFMQTLPDLLAKYGTDSDKVLSLVSVPQCFDLEEYGQRRLGKYLDELLNQLSGVVEKFTDSEILQECAKTYRMLTDNEYTLSTTAEVARNKLVDQFVESFKKSLNKGLDADDDEDSEERFALISSLEKVCAFYKAHDLGKWKLYESLHQIMDRATSDQDTVSDKILNLTLYSMQCLLLWALSGLDPSHPDKSQLKKLKKWISTFIKQCEELVGYSNIEVRTEAFLCMCDLLVVFAKQITNQSALFAPLIYEANVSFQATCRDFIVNHIFANITEDSEEEDEDEDQTDEKVEELSKKRTLLAGFCKLIIYNIFDMGLVAPIFSFLNKAFGDFGDIIKHTMNKCKEINKTTYAKTLLTSLQQEFVCLKDDFQGEVDVKSEDFGLIRDLAHRFALSLGVDTTKSHAREALIKLHREGIHYSLKINKRNSPRKGSGGVPPNLTFLDILNEFTFRLIHQDKVGKNGVLQYLEKEAGEMLKMKGNDWAPLINYRGNLLGNQEGEDNAESPKQDKSKGQRGRPRKSPTQQLPNTGHKHELTSLDCDEDSAEDETPLKRVKKAHISEQMPQEKEMEEFQEEGNSSLQQKRKRMDSELDEESEDFDSIGMPSSQRSWLSSQKKASKRPKLSYSKKGRTSLEDEKEETEIKEFVSDEDADATEKPPIKVRRERHKLPEILFDDSENSKNMEDDLDQPAI